MMVMPSNASGMRMGILAGRYPGRIGHLYSPGAQRGPWADVPYALDNGRFVTWSKGAEWDENAWRALLRWAALSGQHPLWALVPDVPTDREQTLDWFHTYWHYVTQYGFRAALAVQNGMTFDDVPDDDCVLFIGGDDEFKDSAIGPWCARFPGRVHVGRVTRWDRLVRCWKAGAISVDGNGWHHTTNGQFAELSKFLRETTEVDRAA